MLYPFHDLGNDLSHSKSHFPICMLVDRCIRLRVEEDASNEHLGGVHRHSQDDKWGRETDPGGFTSFAALRGSLQ
jgi:hypothetical protein